MATIEVKIAGPDTVLASFSDAGDGSASRSAAAFAQQYAVANVASGVTVYLHDATADEPSTETD